VKKKRRAGQAKRSKGETKEKGEQKCEKKKYKRRTTRGLKNELISSQGDYDFKEGELAPTDKEAASLVRQETFRS